MSNALYIAGNIFGAIASVVTFLSMFQKSKKEIVKYQTINQGFQICASICIGSPTRFVSNVLAFYRDCLAYKDKITKLITAIILIIQLGLGLAINKTGLIGMIPIIASMEYTVALLTIRKSVPLKWAFLINLVMWIAYDLWIGLYTSLIGLIAILISTIVNLITDIRKEKEINYERC